MDAVFCLLDRGGRKARPEMFGFLNVISGRELGLRV